MGAFLARHGKQLAFIPLLLLVGVLALRLVDTVQGGSDGNDTTAVDAGASGATPRADGDRATAPRDPATRAEQRQRQADGGSGGTLSFGSAGGSSSTGGGSLDGGGATAYEGAPLQFQGGSGYTPPPTSSSGGSTGSGGTGGTSGGGTGGDTGGGDSGGSGGDSTGGDSGDGDGSSGGDIDGDTDGDSSPTPSPSPTPEVDPDYNGDGKVSVFEANRYCRDEKGLGPLKPGWGECVNEAQHG